jgi:glycine/D-amino acid oxidase-like deaminating enzyme
MAGVLTDGGPILAPIVVLAAGPWTAGLARPLLIELPIAGARGWLVHLAAGRAVPTRLIGRAGWHVVSERETPEFATAGSWANEGSGSFVGVLVQPNPDGTVLAGGSRAWAVTGEPEDPGLPREIVRRAIRLFPGLAHSRILGAWWGVRPMTPDGRPLVGVVADGLLVASGHGSQGVILGGGSARLVAAIVNGEPPPFDPGPFAPDRFPRTMVG